MKSSIILQTGKTTLLASVLTFSMMIFLLSGIYASKAHAANEASPYLVCSLLGEKDPSKAKIRLFDSKDSFLSFNQLEIRKSIELIQGGFGRCSHVSAKTMVFTKGYSLQYELSAEPSKGANQTLKLKTAFAPHLEHSDLEMMRKRLLSEHPGSKLSSRIEQLVPNSREALVHSMGSQKQKLKVASIYKLFLFNKLIGKIKQGKLDWNSQLNQTGSLTVSQLAKALIQHSSNEAADTLRNHFNQVQFPEAAVHFSEKYLIPEIYLSLSESSENQSAMKAHIQNFAKSRKSKRDYEENYCQKGRCQISHPLSTRDWNLSTQEVCKAMKEAHLESGPEAKQILALHEPFLEKELKSEFSHIGFKGGRDLGVIAAAYALTSRRTGKTYCVSLAWNSKDKDLPLSKFSFAANRAASEIIKHEQTSYPVAEVRHAGLKQAQN